MVLRQYTVYKAISRSYSKPNKYYFKSLYNAALRFGIILADIKNDTPLKIEFEGEDFNDLSQQSEDHPDNYFMMKGIKQLMMLELRHLITILEPLEVFNI